MTGSAPLATTAREGPDWTLCPACRALIFTARLRRDLWVCPDCARHLPMTAQRWLDVLFDPGSVRQADIAVADTDPLGFTDALPYPRRREDARRRTGLTEAAVVVSGTVEGAPVVAAVMDFGFMGGSMGAAVGDLVAGAAALALRERTPLLLVTCSGGARMQEGALSLMQLARTSEAMGRLDAAGILTVCLVTDPTFGGVAASFATLGDVIVAEPGARLGFAGPRVIEQTIRQPLPAGFQTAEFLHGRGLIDLVCPRGRLRPALRRILTLGGPPSARRNPRPLPAAGPAGPAAPHGAAGPAGVDGLVTDPAELPERDPWHSVRLARDIARPGVADFAARAFADFQELHGDRLAKDCPAITGGLARLGRTTVMLIGTRKGHTAAELAAHNFGMASPAGYRKVARLLRLAAKLGVPVVTIVDTPGAHPGIEAEQDGQAFAIADCLRRMARLPVPVVSVIVGEGGSGGALALSVADRVLMFADAVYSVISPEGCAAILWNSAAQAPRAAAALRVGARDLLRLGVVDAVIPEPPGGTQADHQAAADLLRDAVTRQLAELARVPRADLPALRAERFRRFSTLPPQPATAMTVAAAAPAAGRRG
ncbi:acetyl-CoA carboxylase carboxyl transferase subunit beta [Dactylosporangium aurantiacum]|uniref:Multifunctional fusion protein n=1 Tax=Dactylosporangium aurantiacum TaxID=35754 RepID=A0A9Q9MK07_9ACTN|nr:acetyl-CoA carboxylase carboxyltransferase subunit alpha/beta [Dactylosporangium aurantiacum]MDG6101803.1 acetyl-CoA carboxylase carboxyltransferase subunit alpha/beta [Dactylosporangium aurantiacum]UWZ52392.1 acetyl-CoA carboxylase carboxyl transferase subunit beta [Dactylosporangium aurantiacum]